MAALKIATAPAAPPIEAGNTDPWGWRWLLPGDPQIPAPAPNALQTGRRWKQEHTETWRRGLLLPDFRRLWGALVVERERHGRRRYGQQQLANELSKLMKQKAVEVRAKGCGTPAIPDTYGDLAWLENGISRKTIQRLQAEAGLAGK